MTDYTLAQALWLAREYPEAKIDPANVVRIEFVYDYDRGWSTLTPGDGGTFEIRCTHHDGQLAVIYSGHKELRVDLTRMVAEGLQLLEDQR